MEVSPVPLRILVSLTAAFLAFATQAQDLSDEQRAAIAARIAPVGEVCVQGTNCGGLPKAAAPVMAAAPASPAPAAASEAQAPAAASESEAPAAAADAAEAPAVVAAVDTSGIDGAAIYNQACLACHASGVGGAPIVGDAGAWAPRIAKGIDALHSSGINGVAGTAMMAKGGRMDLSDAEVIAAVDYMVSSSQ
jgi:cytochrome c5